MSDKYKVMVAIPTAEFSRRAIFFDYYNALIKPEGTVCTSAHGQSPARGRNLMIEQALELGCDKILFLDDDVAFKPDLLVNLFKHDVDIVTGLYLMRNYPHQPIIFKSAQPDGRCLHYYLNPEDTGLVEIVACGLGACLINTDVFRRLEKPWIRLGELESDHWCDDIGFFMRVRQAGFKMHCDLSQLVGHMGSVTIWPTRNEAGDWFTTYDSEGIATLSTPQQRVTKEQIEEAMSV